MLCRYTYRNGENLKKMCISKVNYYGLSVLLRKPSLQELFNGGNNVEAWGMICMYSYERHAATKLPCSAYLLLFNTCQKPRGPYIKICTPMPQSNWLDKKFPKYHYRPVYNKYLAKEEQLQSRRLEQRMKCKPPQGRYICKTPEQSIDYIGPYRRAGNWQLWLDQRLTSQLNGIDWLTIKLMVHIYIYHWLRNDMSSEILKLFSNT